MSERFEQHVQENLRKEREAIERSDWWKQWGDPIEMPLPDNHDAWRELNGHLRD